MARKGGNPQQPIAGEGAMASMVSELVADEPEGLVTTLGGRSSLLDRLLVLVMTLA